MAMTGSAPDTLAGSTGRPGEAPAGIAWLPAWLLAAALGLAYALCLFGTGFLDQDGIYWLRPVGLAGGAFDLKTNLAGYYWIVQGPWQWPLLWLPHVDTPTGVNAYQFDSMPGLALVGKVLRSLSLGTINLYPAWTILAFVLNPVALVALVRALGQRGLVATLAAAGIGILAPAVHFRFGHPALMAHYFPIFTLALYFQSCREGARPWRYILPAIGLCFVVATLNLYMYVMTAAIAAALFVQAAVGRRIGPIGLVGAFVALLAAAYLPVWSFGALADPNLRAVTVPFGYNSMNLLAPFWPQSSGLLRWTGLYAFTRGSIGATPGQWEGYTYLGAGAVLLIGLAAALRLRSLGAHLRRHWPLAAVLLGLTMWAVSNHIYAGPVLLASYPLPAVLEGSVLAWFRASGRFFWPVGWMLTALGIAGVVASMRPRAALAVVVAALAIQWFDVSYLHGRISDVVHHPAPSQFGSEENVARIDAEIRAHGRLVIVPSFSCRDDALLPVRDAVVANLEAEFIAARANADVWHPTGSRPTHPCDEERARTLADLTGDGVLILLPAAESARRTEEALRDLSCWQAGTALVCTARPAREPRAAGSR